VSIWAELTAHAKPPKWQGPRLVHKLDGPALGRPKTRPAKKIARPFRRWVPWTLLAANSRLLSRAEVARCWPLIKPGATSASAAGALHRHS